MRMIPEFLRKLEQLKLEGHPINWLDLHQEMKHGSFGSTMDLRPYGFSRPKSELPFLRPPPPIKEAGSMTASPDDLRMAGRLSALENLLALLVFDRARIDAPRFSLDQTGTAHIRRGGNFISQRPLPEDIAGRLREETHKATLEFADLLEFQLQELIRTGQIGNPTGEKGNLKKEVILPHILRPYWRRQLSLLAIRTAPRAVMATAGRTYKGITIRL